MLFGYYLALQSGFTDNERRPRGYEPVVVFVVEAANGPTQPETRQVASGWQVSRQTHLPFHRHRHHPANVRRLAVQHTSKVK